MRRSNLRIAVQKSGRLREGSLKFLRKQGLNIPKTTRNAFIVPCGDDIEILFVRYGDIPEYVASGAADYGIVGENLLYEENKKVTLLDKLGFGVCRLVIAVPKKSKIKSISDLEGERIATSYPNSLRKFLRASGLSAAIVNIRGSVEAAPAIGLADAICDLTQSGETIRDNNLEIIDEVFRSEAVFIASKEQSKKSKEFLRKLKGIPA